MNEYDVKEAFRQIELELIASMKRNLSRHQKWETDEGINWTMWQAEQLKTLNTFKKQNKQIFGEKFNVINAHIEDMLQSTYETTGFDQERKILQALRYNKKLKESAGKGIEGSFFKLNAKKMNALINATAKDMNTAETAVLRMVNDKYRKTIFNAQIYANSGAGTLNQAIDMATKDFLSAGINCIEYKDGRRVNIASYAEMAVRTANKRAVLVSDGDVRKQWGIHTVKISQYGQCSETCLPWQGRVYVDDVYSGGTAKEAKELGYPLLSEAIAGGLFHPNCKHRASTYYPELEEDAPENKTEKSNNSEVPETQQEYTKNQREIQRQNRISQGAMDSKTIDNAEERKEQLEHKETQLLEKSVDESSVSASEALMKLYEERRLKHGLNEVSAADLLNSSLNPISADFTGVSAQTAEIFSDTLQELMLEYDSGLTAIKVADKKETFGAKFFAQINHNNAVGQKTMIINPHRSGDYGKMIERVKQLQDKGYALKVPLGMEAKYIPTHEFAHTLIDMESPLKNFIGLDTKPLKSCRKEIKAIYQEYMDEIKILQEEIEEINKNPVFADISSDTKDLLDAFRQYYDAEEKLKSVKLSDYSMKSADEFFAEAFADARLNQGGSKYSRKIDEITNKYFGKSSITESGRYAKETKQIGTNAVDLKYIKSEEFSKKFNQITDNSKVNDQIRTYAQTMLTHRKDSDFEDLYIIDSETGKLLFRKTNSDIKLMVDVKENEIDEILRNHKDKMIAIHNHPTNILPTGADFSAAGYRGYKFGIVVTHDGRVFKYAAGKKPFMAELLDRRIEKYKQAGYNSSIEEAHIRALNEFSEEYGISWEEIKTKKKVKI